MRNGWAVSLGLVLSTSAAGQRFVGNDEFCGYPMFAIPTSQQAVATRDNAGNPVILIDPGVLMNMTTSRRFAIAHECGHHRLGHSTPMGMAMRQYFTVQQELSADCFAAELLASVGLEAESYRVFMERNREGPMRPGTYPSGTERAAVVAQCNNMTRDRKTREEEPDDVGTSVQKYFFAAVLASGTGYSVSHNQIAIPYELSLPVLFSAKSNVALAVRLGGAWVPQHGASIVGGPAFQVYDDERLFSLILDLALGARLGNSNAQLVGRAGLLLKLTAFVLYAQIPVEPQTGLVDFQFGVAFDSMTLSALGIR